MKIKKLLVPEYKNVNVDVTLNADMVTLLVGQNGVGKSNLLEILLLIFDELFQLKEKGKKAKNSSLHYELEYECKGRYFTISKISDKHNFKEYTIETDGTKNLWAIDIQALELPNQIVGYYSGENKRIRKLVEKHIQSEERAKRIRYSKGKYNVFCPRKLFFAENRHSMLVLATLLLYKDHHLYGENIKKVLYDILKVDCWDRIYLKFRNPRITKTAKLRKEGLTLEYYRDLLLQGYDLRDTPIFWGVRGIVDKLLRLLLYFSIDNGWNYGIMSNKQGTREYFEIENIPSDDNFKDLLYESFPTPMEFLNALEECFVLNMVEKFDIELHKKGERERYPYIHLSEGEQQYLTVMGLIALSHSSQDETLFLLDEPDTHINPQWQRSYIQHILDLSRTETEKKSKEFFISTHSPLLVQANYHGNTDVDVLLFKRDENGKVKIDTEDNELYKNWRIDQVLMSKYFELPSSRPASLDGFMRRRDSFINASNDCKEKNILCADADEFGYLPTGETMADVEAMAYIHQMAEKLKKEGNL